MDPRDLLFVEPLEHIVRPDPPRPDEGRRARGQEHGRQEDDEGEADGDDAEGHGGKDGDEEGEDDGEEDDGYGHEGEESQGRARKSEMGEEEGLKRGKGEQLAWTISLRKGRRKGGRLTANIGFSVANLESLAESSLRFSGGKMRSMKAEPRSRAPVRVPWMEPVRPETASAMIERGKKRREVFYLPLYKNVTAGKEWKENKGRELEDSTERRGKGGRLLGLEKEAKDAELG